jgi:adenine deaminase
MNYGCIVANVVDVTERVIFLAELHWENGTISVIKKLGAENPQFDYLLMGFIDAHVHIESSMLAPCEFARIACRHGTVATVSDPHEIANVLGRAGIEFMLENAALTPMPIFFGAPSCVPATGFETAGAVLESSDLQPLFAQQSVHYLSELMNYPAVLNQDANIMAKLQLAQRYGCPIDGHAPNLTGEAMQRYVQAGISTDHECTSLTEAKEKLAAGMMILIREGSAARNFDTLHSLISDYPDKVMFCSDDKHPDDLVAGHINQLVTRAVALGHSVFDVLRCASLNPIQHYGLPIGQLRVGDRMDAVLVNNLRDFMPLTTWLAGQKVAENGLSLLPYITAMPINCFHAQPITAEDLLIAASGTEIRVIKALDGELLTLETRHAANIIDGKLLPDPERDILLLTVINRYRVVKPAVAFIEGFGLMNGALASSVAHDSHNVIAVGSSAELVTKAVNAVITAQGGIAVVTPDTVELLALPIAGLMSNEDGDNVAACYAKLDATAKRLGSPLRAPFMTLSFMALLVIPELKLSDLGLFDGRTFSFTALSVE